MQMGEVEKAFAAADRYIREHPDSRLSEELLLRRGDFYFGQQKFQQAIAAYQNFLKRYPGSLMAPKAQYWIGLSYVNLKDYDRAVAAFRKVINQYPGSEVVPDALFQLGILLRENGQPQKALQQFRRILQGKFARNQDSAFLSEVHLQIGLTHLKQASPDKAQQAFRKAITVAPQSFSAYRARIELARLEVARKNETEARRLLEQVIQNRNDELAAEAQKVMGDLYFELGKYQDAVTNYLRVKYVYSAYPGWVARALYRAGLTYEKMGQPEKAKKLYREVVEKFAAEKISEQAKERLSAL
jgi:tol-pal system protein YbgF